MIGKILAGRYEIQSKIGSGGMAVVYKAHCTWLDRIVTVKVLRDDLVNDAEFVRRFRQEAQAVAKLSHPNIVSVYDVGQEAGIHYIVMEYIDGKNLKEIIQEKGKLPLDKAVDYMLQICSALDHAHENNIIHRDIKPHNILITQRGRVKVTDFGIARAVTGVTVTNPGKLLGSVHYLSPEQARGEVVGISSDLYSAGAVFYEMLTGQVPFEGDSPISVALKHLQDPIIPPRQLDQTIPQPYEGVVLRALDKNPLNRFTSARDMQSILQSIRQGDILEYKPEMVHVSPYQGDNQTLAASWADETHSFDRVEEKELTPARNPNQQPKKRKPRPAFWVLIGVVTLLVFSGLVYLGARLVQVPDIEVPDLRGKKESEAVQTLQALGLKGVVDPNKQYDSLIPAGQVISQSPEAGTMVKKGRQIDLFVSQGTEMIVLPNMKEWSFSDAEKQLQSLGIYAVNDKQIPDSRIGKGFIISQDPLPDTQVTPGSTVKFTVSSGPPVQSFAMPNLLGKTVEEARTLIKDLTLGPVKNESSTQYATGQIISQTPAVSSPVSAGDTVSVTVSSGPGPSPKSKAVKFTVDENGPDQVQVVISVEDTQGAREAYKKMHAPGDEVVVTVRYNPPAKIKVYVDEKLKSEEELSQ